MDARNLAELYDLPTLQWEPVAARLERGVSQAPGTGGPGRHTCWLATIDPDGRPRQNGIGAMWAHGTFFFETGESSRKARNLARDPRCSLSVATDEFDLVVLATASIVRERALIADLAERWSAEGWPCRVDESGSALTADYSAPSAGPPPWAVYRLAIERATVLGITEPGGATTFRF